MKKLILSVLFCCILFDIQSQEATFLNNNQSLLFINPSFAGSNGNCRIQSTYSGVNRNINASQFNSYTAIDAFIKPLKGAFSLSYLNDDLYRGLLKDQRLSLGYAQHFKIRKNTIQLIPSFEFTYFQRQVDAMRFVFEDAGGAVQYQYYPPGTKRNLNLSTGLLINYKNIYGGVAIKNLNQPDIGVAGQSKLPSSINIHGSYTKSINENTFIQFFTLYNHQYSTNTILLNINATFKKHLVIGFGIRSNSQSSISLGFRNNYMTSVISYGKEFNQMAGNGNNTLNVSLASSLGKKKNKSWIGNFEKW